MALHLALPWPALIYGRSYTDQPHLSPMCACQWEKIVPVPEAWARSCPAFLVQPANTRRTSISQTQRSLFSEILPLHTTPASKSTGTLIALEGPFFPGLLGNETANMASLMVTIQGFIFFSLPIFYMEANPFFLASLQEEGQG